MKLTLAQQQLVKQFNQPATQLVISRWPQKGSCYDGIATYTQDIVTRFAKKYQTKFVVLAEQATLSPSEEFLEVGEYILVVRAFDERKFHLYPQVLTWLKAFPKVKQVYVHSEFCASGGPVLRFLVIPFLALIRLTGRNITFYAHNVVKSLDGYEQHLGLREKSWKLALLSQGYRWYFRCLAGLVQTFVVLEAVVANRLQTLVGNRQVLVEPHWVAPAKTTLTQAKAKKLLKISSKTKVVLSFGFVTHYKGADFVAKWARWLNTKQKLANVQVVLGGGMAYSLKDKKYYQTYYEEIKKLSDANDNLTLTGFLSEREVELWLKAADLVIFPYRNLMGGSGALQQALRYGKPVLMSTQMAKGLGIDLPAITFTHQFGELEKLIKRYFANLAYRNQVKTFSRNFSRNLSVGQLLPKHYTEVYQSEPAAVKLRWYGRLMTEGLKNVQTRWAKLSLSE